MGSIRIIAALALSLSCSGANWYCRPPVISGVGGGGIPLPIAGVYGDQDGTSYANAWNGLRSVVWGTGGVEAGDTLWVCGPQVHWINSGWFDSGKTLVSVSGTSESPVTIRGDYPGDSGDIYGIARDMRRPWEGPDANGVYFQQEGGAVGSVYISYMETDGPPTANGLVYILTNKSPSTTWIDGSGATFIDSSGNTTNFVKPNILVGGTISTNIFMDDYGYYFDLGSSSNIVFSGLAFTRSRTIATISGDGSMTANNITFTNCSFRFMLTQWVYPGWDDWTFDHCAFSESGNAIYTRTDGKPNGAHRLTVRYCTFRDIGFARQESIADGRFLHGDSHAIGIQSGVGHLIEHNDIQRTGSAIEFWNSYQGMSNHVVRYNFIKDIYVATTTGGHGVVISGEAQAPGLRTGIEIYGNIIVNVGLNQDEDWQGAGVSSNSADPISVYNNTILNPYLGVRVAVNGAYPVTGNFKNNIIVNPRSFNLRFTGTGATTADVNYNLFYPSPNSSDNFNLSPSFTHDANSVFGSEPLFANGAATVDTDFKLQASSPAIGAGVDVDVNFDFFGVPYINPPAIGAAEFTGINPPKKPRRNGPGRFRGM